MKSSIKKWYQVVVEPFMSSAKESVRSNKYSRVITIALTVLMVAFVAFWGYRWWNRQRESSALKAFNECLYAYQEALQGKDGSAWGNVAMLFKVGSEQHSSSTLAPYFQMYYADALLKQGNRAEAIAKMEEAIKASAHSPFLNMYKTKLALVKLDDETSAISEEGLKALKALADDEKNNNRDMALYYEGLYYWTKGNMAEAKAAWQKLVDVFKAEKIGVSPWLSLARAKLEQIV